MNDRFRDRMRRERMDVILREASVLAADHGWGALRVEDIAQRVGVAKGTIYLDFKDKSELVVAASERSMNELLALLRAAVDDGVEGEGLNAALDLLSRLPVEQPHLTALIGWGRPEGAGEGTMAAVEGYLGELIRGAQAREAVPAEVDTEFAAQLLLAAVAVPAWSRIAITQGPEALLRQMELAVPAAASALGERTAR
jgi:AcrR family transcriptional regulator